MRLMEFITLRTRGNNRIFDQQQFKDIVHQESKQENCEKLEIFYHSTISTDFCVLLIHESGATEKSGSELGIRLSWLLEEYGFVNHTVWFEAGI